MTIYIDINADIGEGYGSYLQANESEMYPFITSANIACGFHAGDFMTIPSSIALAKKHGVAIGAHPGYPDRYGFGRKPMEFTAEEIYSMTLYQLGAIGQNADAQEVPLSHIKAHGALYHHVNSSSEAANAFMKAIQATKRPLFIYTIGGTVLEKVAREKGVRVVKEGFADRRYDANANIVPRSELNATLDDPVEMVQQIDFLVREKGIETICFHSDHPGALEKIHMVRNLLAEKGYAFRNIT
ncbi:5-oxoprolinase subunit PxpA [Mangrovibacillus cuniculi]|uniref:LamB/YcsF family protein n=1 Tax=Mangrovibacillus cuniculi TaxID=2593652 RepID=A0A7S8HG66_9BACI|nr:5-oxoprolinase subunit PxpA [Mangrovibacillus cuniculi]QPC47674.1 LamB/YcsF family protein [Mangrovibacillus cuniculi]